VHDLERFLNMLGTIASISPLLGLLGTVTGIIKAFDALQAGAAGDPRMLSGGIAEALIATAAGLCVAIPALIAYRYLRGRVEGFVIEMEKDAIKLADALEAAGHAGHAGHAAPEPARAGTHEGPRPAVHESARVEALRGEGARADVQAARTELLKARR